ncbi:MAG TPA: lipopolysaccharide biosynthesis protein [Terriglobales bacterium]|nr:lipopolysaccharide biosynthesis protein [Terriglobales bacterium]
MASLSEFRDETSPATQDGNGEVTTTELPNIRAAQAGADGSLAASTIGSSKVLRARLLSGSMIMLISSALVGGINLVYNILIARLLGAVQFGHAAAVYTMLMLLSSVTLAFQLVCSKFIAQSQTIEEKAGIYAALHRRSWQIGIVVGSALVWASVPISHYLNLPKPIYIVLLGVGTALYVPLGVRRGLLQGMYEFRRLAENFVVEVLVKLVFAIALLAMGFGVTGVIAAVAISLGVSYLLAVPAKALRIAVKAHLPTSFWEGMQATVFFIGQVIINNVDIVLVKHFFDPARAGLYAAIALVGRVVYMLSWSIVSSMFPVSAGARSDERGGKLVLSTAFLMVSGLTGAFLFCLWLAPNSIWKVLLGNGFPPLGGRSPYTSLLLLYAGATGVYSLAVVLMTYEMSRKLVNLAWTQLCVSGAVVLGIYMFHGNLHQVIMVQMVLMLGLLVVVAAPLMKSQAQAPVRLALGHMKLLRQVSEEEVLSEFLKNEFYEKQFERYHDKLADVVYRPNLQHDRENDLRRALLFRRRGKMWRELPSDTQWWEVELSPADFSRIRVFPRAQWRGVAKGNFGLLNVVERLRERIQDASEASGFYAKIASLSAKLPGISTPSSILLIGVNRSGPFTIIEGNHRLAAAMLVSPDLALSRFRFLVGFSPHMTECCWYQTDISTLWRYGKNRVKYMRHDQDEAIERMLAGTEQSEAI